MLTSLHSWVTSKEQTSINETCVKFLQALNNGHCADKLYEILTVRFLPIKRRARANTEASESAPILESCHGDVHVAMTVRTELSANYNTCSYARNSS